MAACSVTAIALLLLLPREAVAQMPMPAFPHAIDAAAAGSAANAATTPRPYLTWADYPVRPGQTVLLEGSNLPLDAAVEITAVSSGQVRSVQPWPGQGSANSLKFALPADLPMDVYSIIVGGSSPLLVNAPEVWSFHGDLGNSSTPGSLLRLFGRGLALVPTTPDVTPDTERSWMPGASAPPAGLTAAQTERELVALIGDALARQQRIDAQRLLDELQQSLAQHRIVAPAATATTTTRLMLTPEGLAARHEVVVLTALQADNFTASFVLPPSLALGQYRLSISNSPNDSLPYMDVSVFVSPTRPVVSTLNVRAPLAWRAERFVVPLPPPGQRYPTCKGAYGSKPGDPSRAYDSMADIATTMVKAQQNGGGTVFFRRGQYWLSGPLVVPPGVRVEGEGQSLVSLYFREDTRETAPKPSYVYSNIASVHPQNASGLLQLIPQAAGCGAQGCCVAAYDGASPSHVVLQACNHSSPRQGVNITVGHDATGGAAVSLAWGNRCLASSAGRPVLSSSICGTAEALWRIQPGLDGDSHLLQVQQLPIAAGCLTAAVPRNSKAKPRTELELDQCWHINATANFIIPGIAPPPPPVTPTTTAWAVANITLYISHWYNGVFTVDNPEFFSLRGVRVRANPWFAENPSDRQNSTRGRTAPYQIGNMFNSHMLVANAENFEVLDCDLFSAGGSVIHSSRNGPARFGNVARNRIFNGMTSHWFDNARNVIFEDNWMTGVSLTAYGNNIDTYGGGYAQNIVLRNNTVGYHCKSRLHSTCIWRLFCTPPPLDHRFFQSFPFPVALPLHPVLCATS